MFNSESKLAVLESKFTMYEELSKEMLSKLESAVDKISEGNSRIATILTKHDERIEQAIKTDDLILKMVEEVKEDNKKDHSAVMKRVSALEVKLEEITKFRWLIVGGALLATFLISQPHMVIDLLTPDQAPVKLEGTK
jgi:putative NADH-flavin reductase